MRTTRRDWIRSSALIGGIAVPQLAHAQLFKKSGANIKLGVASYSFRKFKREQVIPMMKELGTPYLNVKDFHLALTSTPDEIKAARAEFKKAGIVLVGCGNVSFSKDDDADIKAKFEYAKMAGFPLIVCAPTATTLPKLEKYVKEYNIKIAVHNHGPEDHNFPSPQSVLKIVKDLDPRCGLCIDVGHTVRAGSDVVESIVEAGPRLLDMHAKDLTDLKVKESQVPVGEGKIDFPGIFKQLIKMKYQGCVNLEYEIQADDPMAGMKKSFEHMRKVLKQEGAKQA